MQIPGGRNRMEEASPWLSEHLLSWEQFHLFYNLLELLLEDRNWKLSLPEKGSLTLLLRQLLLSSSNTSGNSSRKTNGFINSDRKPMIIPID